MSETPTYEAGPENELPKPQWQKPSLAEEMGELERHAEESGINLDSLVSAFEKAELQELSDEDWVNMENSDSSDTTWTADQVREYLEGKRDFQKIENGLKRGDMIPAPVVLYRAGHRPNLLAGNSRLLGCRALGMRPTVLGIHLNE
jgi:hypothetical protein